METIKIISWIIATLGFCIFIQFWLYPFLRNKYVFWKLSRVMRKMAKKYDGEIKEQLEKAADGLMNLSKNEKIDDQ